MTYPPTRSGINPLILQDWPRPAFREILDTIGQPTQKQKGCTCDCHQPGPRYTDHYFIRTDAPNLMSGQIEQRLIENTHRRYTMDCADCCKAAKYDENFFYIDPRGSITTTVDPTTPGTRVTMTKLAHRLVDEQIRPSLNAPSRQGGSLKPYEGRQSEVYEQWIEGWTIQQIPNNLERHKAPRINFPNRLYATQSQAIKGWLTERKGLSEQGHERDRCSDSFKGSRRIQPTRVMDRYSHSDSLQLTGMSQPGEGWLRVEQLQRKGTLQRPS